MKTHRFRPLSGSYISQYFNFSITRMIEVFPSPIGELHFSIFNIIFILFQLFGFRPLSGSYISQSRWVNAKKLRVETVSVPYRGATFLNPICTIVLYPYTCFRPLSGSYISQYHPRNPMSCLGRIGGLRGKSNFIEMQPFWKVKNSHKSSI